MSEIAEFCIKMQGAGLSVPEKLLLEGNPNDPSRGSGSHDDVEELGGDGSIEPAEDGALHPCPGDVVRGSSIRKDVVAEGILAHGEEKEPAPLGVVRRVQVEDDGDEGLDAEDGDRLCVERGDGGGFRERYGLSIGHDVRDGRDRSLLMGDVDPVKTLELRLLIGGGLEKAFDLGVLLCLSEETSHGKEPRKKDAAAAGLESRRRQQNKVSGSRIERLQDQRLVIP